ncbi:MAG: hypothetical protein M3N98_08800 [Actinomycetota bacterium]|nr:hypothetical protein [Actinomycetota bacterium]
MPRRVDDNDGGPTAAASLIAVSGGAGSRSPASGRPRVGAPVRLNLSVDLDAWLRGFPIEDETCELVGHGPVPMSVVRKLLAQGDPFVCSANAHLRIDHRTDWAKTHFTMLDWLDRLCIHHHNRKTRDNWALVDGIGKRPFVPPDDPRPPQAPKQPSTNPPPTAA